jgi:hypothetical protein
VFGGDAMVGLGGLCGVQSQRGASRNRADGREVPPRRRGCGDTEHRRRRRCRRPGAPGRRHEGGVVSRWMHECVDHRRHPPVHGGQVQNSALRAGRQRGSTRSRWRYPEPRRARSPPRRCSRGRDRGVPTIATVLRHGASVGSARGVRQGAPSVGPDGVQGPTAGRRGAPPPSETGSTNAGGHRRSTSARNRRVRRGSRVGRQASSTDAGGTSGGLDGER